MKLGERHISNIKKFFKKQPVLKAYLFGSQARNDVNESSDIDLLIELDLTKPIGLEFIKMQLDLQDLLKCKVDLLTLNSISKYILPYIEEDKLLIYEKRNQRQGKN